MSFIMSIHDLDLRDSSNLHASTGASFYIVCGCLINGFCSLGPSSGLLFHAPTCTHVIPTWDALLWPLNSSSSFSDPRFSAIILNVPQDPNPRLSFHGETPLSVAASNCTVSPNHTRLVWMLQVMTPHRPKLRREFIIHVMTLARETWAGTLAGHLTE